jgi:hypothetical protein
MAGGYTMSLPQEDRSYKGRKEMLEDIRVLLGGRVAEALTLDDNGNIKGWKDKVDGLRTQFPNMFEAANDGSNPDGYEVVPLSLRKGSGGNDAPTKESFRNMTYEQRVALKQQNESLYRQLRGN